jgi:hypothetical protein
MKAQERQVMQQALEALETCSGVPHWPALQPTIADLREALASPQPATGAIDLARKQAQRIAELEQQLAALQVVPAQNQEDYTPLQY